MKKLACAFGFLAVAGVLLAAGAARVAPTVAFPSYGFKIAPLEGEDEATDFVAVMMYLPPRDGFRPNVNVNIQPYAGTMKQYAKLSEQQCEAMGWKVLDERVDETSGRWEYTGKFNGTPMHWYARALKRGDQVYLVTATAMEKHWDEVSEPLRACVDSFELDEKQADEANEAAGAG